LTNSGDLQISSQHLPGILELLDENEPDLEKLSQYVSIGGVSPAALSRESIKAAAQGVIRWLKGYRKTQELYKRKPIWTPVIELYAPPGGKATFSQTSTSVKEGGPKFQFLGVNYGSSESVSFSQSISFDTNKAKSFQVEMLVTVTRYEHPKREPLFRIDFEHNNDRIGHRYQDLPVAVAITNI
jgi:hypothetical protein